MNPFSTLAGYLRREPWTVAMLAVIVSALVWQASFHAPAAPAASGSAVVESDAAVEPAAWEDRSGAKDPHSEANRLETTRQMAALEARIMKDPKLRTTVGLVVFLVLGLGVLGFIWGILLLKSVRRGERWMERFGSPQVSWGLADAFRAVVLMFFLDLALTAGFSYLFGLMGIQTANWGLMAGILVRSVLLMMYLGWTVHRQGGGWADLGVCANRPLRQMLWGLGGYLAMIPVYLLVLAVLVVVLNVLQVKSPVQTPVQILYTESNAGAMIAFVFFMGVLGPWFEEVLFRGYVYPALRARMGVWPGMLVSSAVFAALHGHGIAFVPILVLGVTLHLLYERSGSIVPGAFLHMVHNCAMLGLTLAIRQMTTAASAAATAVSAVS